MDLFFDLARYVTLSDVASVITIIGSIQEVSLEIARLDVVLSSLENKLDRKSTKFVVQLQQKIRAYKPRKQGQEPLFEIYVDLHTILEELDELQKDAKWER